MYKINILATLDVGENKEAQKEIKCLYSNFRWTDLTSYQNRSTFQHQQTSYYYRSGYPVEHADMRKG